MLDSRSRIEKRLLDLEEKLEEMDAKFEHNIAAMNELLLAAGWSTAAYLAYSSAQLSSRWGS